MTDERDIMERLSYRPLYGWPEERATAVIPTLGEAAAEITRLRAELAAARDAALEEAAQWHDARCLLVDSFMSQYHAASAYGIRALKGKK